MSEDKKTRSYPVVVPDLGNFSDVAVIELLVQPGDSVQVDTPLITLETEKATMDVPSPEAGVIERLHVQKGSHVSAGSPIATLQVAEATAAKPGAAPQPQPQPQPQPAAPPRPAAAPAPAAPAPAPPAKPAAPPKSTPPAADDTLRVPAALS